MNMLVVVFVMACMVGSMAQDDKQAELLKKLSDWSTECAKENDVDTKIIEGVAKGMMPDPKIFEEKKYKCYMKCFNVKSGLVTESGDPKVDKVKEMFQIPDDSPMLETMKKCGAEVTDTDQCDKAYNLYKCIMEKMPKKP